MPQQLIYTSAPRGIVAGRSGHCTVARSATMRDALMLQLERFCYYQHLSLSGGRDRPIFSCRVVDIRGTRFHVLSRIQDAGLDFTGRTNFIAHHLVFTPEEIRRFPTPPVILRNWRGWLNSWTREPELLENETWDELTALVGQVNVPAQTWQQVTGDAVNGYGLLEARVGASFRADDLSDETILALLSESLELLEICDARRDFRGVAWNYTFTTSMQEQDNPADFRWRCIHPDNPAAARLATPDCRALADVRAAKLTSEETAFARTGRLAPRFISEPADIQVIEGEPARFTAKAEGVPTPAYQWYKCNKDGKDIELLKGETSSEMSLRNPPPGVTRYRVWASNNLKTAQSRLAVLSVEKKIKLTPAMPVTSPSPPAKPPPYNVKSAEAIESQRQHLDAERAEEVHQQRQQSKKIIGTCLVLILIMGTAMFIYGKKLNAKAPFFIEQPFVQTNSDNSVNIVVRASGRPPVSYQWYKDDQLISSTTDSSFSPGQIFGVFHVVATNKAGAVTSSNVPWLGDLPKIKRRPFVTTNNEDSWAKTQTINVSVESATPVSYQWYRDNQPIAPGTNDTLTPYLAGDFYVTVSNRAGTVTSERIHWAPPLLAIGKKSTNRGTALFDSELSRQNETNAAATQTNLSVRIPQ